MIDSMFVVDYNVIYMFFICIKFLKLVNASLTSGDKIEAECLIVELEG